MSAMGSQQGKAKVFPDKFPNRCTAQTQAFQGKTPLLWSGSQRNRRTLNLSLIGRAATCSDTVGPRLPQGRKTGAISASGIKTKARWAIRGWGSSRSTACRLSIIQTPDFLPKISKSRSMTLGPHRTPRRRPTKRSTSKRQSIRSVGGNKVRTSQTPLRNFGWRIPPQGSLE